MITVLEFTRSSSLRKKSTKVGSLFSPIRIPFLSKIALLTKGKVEAIIDELRPLEIFVLLNVFILLEK